MDPKIINGKEIAQKRMDKLKQIVSSLAVRPKVVSILIGDDPPSVLYTNIKQKKALELGIEFEPIRLPVGTDFYKVMQLIIQLNEDPNTHGIMMQLPLPREFLQNHKTQELLELIKKDKDVDGLTKGSHFLTAAVEAVRCIFEEEGINLKGKYAVMVGASELIGKPIAKIMKDEGAMVKICDSKTLNLSKYTQKADIIVSATGVPGLIRGEMVKQGVVVIDVGVMVMEEKEDQKNQEGNTDTPYPKKVFGDVDFGSVYPKASKITPVPGGVGPITVTSLMENVIKSLSTS